ncbi:pyocin activator PrtN family protein [Spongorhabdus nitratireducens]
MEKLIEHLRREFNDHTLITLDQLIERGYLKMTLQTAIKKANLDALPFPAIRLGKSQKCPYVVSIFDYAQWLHRLRSEALEEWNQINKDMKYILDLS